MANANDIADVKRQIGAKISSLSGNIKAINGFTQSIALALRYLTSKITALKLQGADGQQRAQELYQELDAILTQLNNIDEISPQFIEAINTIIRLANQEKPEGQEDIQEVGLPQAQSGGRKSRKSKKSRKSRKSKKSRKSRKSRKSKKSRKTIKGGYRYNKKLLSRKKSSRKKLR